MLRLIQWMVPVWLFLLAAGCAQLPEYARPRLRVFDYEKDSSEQGVIYRQLTVEDFRAFSLPKDSITHAKNLNAHVCTRIQLTGDSKFIVNPVHYPGKTFYFASIKDIAFEAAMIPSCSWWNPRVPEEKKAYVLQHEQIHFALTEIAARKLTQEAQDAAGSLLVIQPTREEARNEISAKIRDMVKAALDEMLKEHTAFDNDTSLIFNPTKQRMWLERVEKQLRNTEVEGVTISGYPESPNETHRLIFKAYAGWRNLAFVDIQVNALTIRSG